MIGKDYRYRIQHACFACRKAFKFEYLTGEQNRSAWLSRKLSGKKPKDEFVEPARTCPQCGGSVQMMGRAFRAPKSDDVEGWHIVFILRQAGFTFYSSVGELPTTKRDTKEFLSKHLPKSPGLILQRKIAAKKA